LREGEILGVYGLMGAGRTELFECLIGLHPESSGTISLNGAPISRSATIDERIDRGLVLVPEDRQRVGIVQSLSVGSNMTLASLSKHVKTGILSFKSELQAVGDMIKELSLRFRRRSSGHCLGGATNRKLW
jgi:erythritol transport system ATP-binding protein